MMKQITDNVAAAMAGKMDDEFRAVLNEAWPTGWTLEDVKRRCVLVRYHDSEVETLCIDGVPALELHPLELESVKTDTGWTYRVTRNYRRFPVRTG
jgi:hypothetical protein